MIFRTQIIAHPLDAPGGFEAAIRQPKPGAPVRLLGDGRGLTRPIAQADVVRALLAVIEGRGRAGTWDLVGPEALSLNEVVRLYNGGPVPIAHTPGWLARPLSRVVPGLSPTFVDLFLRPAPPGDPEPLVRQLGLRLTPLSVLWARPPTGAGRHPPAPVAAGRRAATVPDGSGRRYRSPSGGGAPWAPGSQEVM